MCDLKGEAGGGGVINVCGKGKSKVFLACLPGCNKTKRSLVWTTLCDAPCHIWFILLKVPELMFTGAYVLC